MDFLYNNQEEPWINFFAHEFGLEIVHRKSGTYIRETPDRYQGQAKETAAIFGAINHDNAGETGHVIKNGRIYSLAPMKSAAEFAGIRVKPAETKQQKFTKKVEDVTKHLNIIE